MREFDFILTVLLMAGVWTVYLLVRFGRLNLRESILGRRFQRLLMADWGFLCILLGIALATFPTRQKNPAFNAMQIAGIVLMLGGSIPIIAHGFRRLRRHTREQQDR